MLAALLPGTAATGAKIASYGCAATVYTYLLQPGSPCSAGSRHIMPSSWQALGLSDQLQQQELQARGCIAAAVPRPCLCHVRYCTSYTKPCMPAHVRNRKSVLHSVRTKAVSYLEFSQCGICRLNT